MADAAVMAGVGSVLERDPERGAALHDGHGPDDL
jgi:hypothetical protein